jgi:3-oxoacyl-[acyl-carrier protein] reductase
MLLSDRVAIITGGARGVGRGIARKFTEEGCSVAIADILEDRAKETAAELVKLGKKALAIKCDHTNSKQVEEMVNETISKFGKIDILVNNAGVPPPAKTITDMTEAEWHNNVNINLLGPFLCSKYVVPHMKARKFGCIIHFSSYAGINPTPSPVSYAAAKAGVLGMTYSMAVELAPFHIRVNAITPNMVRTEFFGPPSSERDAFFEIQSRGQLMGRMATPEDIAGVALFLASDLSSYITGTDIMAGAVYPPGCSAPASS